MVIQVLNSKLGYNLVSLGREDGCRCDRNT